MIHTANPMEHASHMAAQPQFVHPEHRSFVDLSGHNLANPHPFAGRPVGSCQEPSACSEQPGRQVLWPRSHVEPEAPTEGRLGRGCGQC